MGPGSTATPNEISIAEIVGGYIARNGHYTLTGGSNLGVMNAALRGAKKYDPDARTIAILSHGGEPEKTSEYADVCIPTGMGEGRNYMNIRSCDIIVICCNDVRLSSGTFSEFNFTIKLKKPLIIFHEKEEGVNRKFSSNWSQLLNKIPEENRHDAQVVVSFLGDFEKMLDSMIDRHSLTSS